MLEVSGGKILRPEVCPDWDFGLAESTPVLWKGRLARFDSVHIEYGRPVGSSRMRVGGSTEIVVQ